MFKMILRVLFLLCTIIYLCSCSQEHTSDTITDPPPVIVEETIFAADRNDGWDIVSVDSSGLDITMMKELYDYCNTNNFEKLHSIVIVKDGKLVFEKYLPGLAYYTNIPRDFDWNVRHYAASTTKSINATLIGIALYKGYINSTEDKLKDFFPEFDYIDWSGDKGEITLKDLLTMSSGLKWDEWSYPFEDPRNSLYQMNYSPDPIKMFMELEPEYTPGTRFVYSSLTSIILGEIVKRSTDKNPNQFARETLFGPLKISNYTWSTFAGGIVHTGGGLDMVPRDMAKIGQLYLNNGLWKGERLFGEEWVEKATKSYLPTFTSPHTGYGYQWWSERFDYNNGFLTSYCAEGHGGQYICVLPSQNIVVTMNAGYYENDPFPILRDIIENYILRAYN